MVQAFANNAEVLQFECCKLHRTADAPRGRCSGSQLCRSLSHRHWHFSTRQSLGTGEPRSSATSQVVRRKCTWARKYKYAALENISNRKMGKNVMRLYFAVLIVLPAKPAVLSAGCPPARLTVLVALATACFSASASGCKTKQCVV